ncbi:MAG: murein biosynthesis integral membrane protein MurJ [Anaerococcus sp.]|uniref:murein biosynthesis integral membrane protein MurJ n=1 Tax=Anaerococcus sp. TaxID=1872515 RepID=UPI0028FF020A|nr:murein biosynthesis integral membrane protein MurJ [Anaerococcus sp.]MDU2353336.1 murein biosynthesis integral membrane protein MurJ [Anaerococcus sp.]
MGQTTIVLMILTVISKIFGFVRESVMAAYIGAGELKSVYTTASTFPALLINVVVTGIASSYIPTYNKVEKESGSKKAQLFTSNLINILMIFGVIIYVLVFIFAEPITKLLSPNLIGEWLNLTVTYTRIMMIAVFAFLYASVIKGYLNIKGNFTDPVITGLILNIIIIISTILTGKIKNPLILIYGTLIANIIQYIRFPFSARKVGFQYKKNLDFSDRYIKYILAMVIPLMLSSAVDQLSILIDNSMASAFFGVSSVSKIYYAKTMLNFILGVVTLSIATVTFPDIAKLGQSGDLVQMQKKLGTSIVFAMLLVIPATFGMMALAKPIIQLAFERKAFTPNDTEIVSSLLISYGPYIIFTSIIKIMANGFYSLGDAKTPVKIVLIQQIINIVLNFILIKFSGIDGLAYSTSISTAIGSVLLALTFSKRVGNDNIKYFSLSIIKIFVWSLIISITAKFIYRFLINYVSLIPSLFISVVVAGILFIGLISLSKIPELNELKISIGNKIKKKEREDHEN